MVEQVIHFSTVKEPGNQRCCKTCKRWDADDEPKCYYDPTDRNDFTLCPCKRHGYWTLWDHKCRFWGKL